MTIAVDLDVKQQTKPKIHVYLYNAIEFRLCFKRFNAKTAYFCLFVCLVLNDASTLVGH